MSRTDAMRWRNWHQGREVRRCRCGRKFMPDIPRQELCRVCAGREAERERAPVTAAQADHEKLLRLLDEALADDDRHRPIPLADPPSDRARLRRRASRTLERLDGAVPVKQRGKRARRSSAPQWAPVARAKIAEGWSLRKIAKLIGVNVDDVRLWGAVTAEELRFRAAADGKDRPRPVQAPPARTGELPWCYAEQHGTCRLCRQSIFAGDKLARVDERWVHASCAEDLGYTLVVVDRRSSARRKAEARMQEPPTS